MTQHRVTDVPEASPEEPVIDLPETTVQSDPHEAADSADVEEKEAAEAPVAPDIAALKRERDDYYDRFMRKAAEFDNYRKRIERERREQADQAVVELLRELLAVVDDFDIALTVEAGETAAAYRKGIELIHAKLQDVLRKYRVRPIEALGADFDPNVHQAVIHEESSEHREGEVIGELRKGYMMGDRLLRPAMVKVAKA
jgi:molecular chaperone GrpE